MSWGELSCTKIAKECGEERTMTTCNVNCPGYVDGKSPDSPKVEEVVETKLITCPEDLGLTRSKLPTFSKKHEVVVLKNHLFRIQSVAHKKIILKLFSKDAHPILTDGVYHTLEVNKEKKDGK